MAITDAVATVQALTSAGRRSNMASRACLEPPERRSSPMLIRQSTISTRADAFAVATVAPKTERRIRDIGAQVQTFTRAPGAREGAAEASGAREARHKFRPVPFAF